MMDEVSLESNVDDGEDVTAPEPMPDVIIPDVVNHGYCG